MDHDALITKLQKLLALAQRGEGGEAINARSLLDKMLVQYGIDEASLTDIRTGLAWIAVSSNWRKTSKSRKTPCGKKSKN